MSRRCALVISSTNNVFNLVSLLARADRANPVLIFADPDSRSSGHDQRLEAALRQRGYHRTRTIPIADWKPGTLEKALAAGLAWAGAVEACDFHAIGGRKHDAILLRDLAIRRFPSLETISVHQRPPAIIVSRLAGEAPGHEVRALSQVAEERLLQLSEILTVHGYRLASGEALKPEHDVKVSGINPGQQFEAWVAKLVCTCLREDPSLNGLVAGVWRNVKLAMPGSKDVVLELDNLLLLRDGAALHLECKSGDVGNLKSIQSQVLLFKQAFSERSHFAVCRDLRAVRPEAWEQSIRDMRRIFARAPDISVMAVHGGIAVGAPPRTGMPSARETLTNLIRRIAG